MLNTCNFASTVASKEHDNREEGGKKIQSSSSHEVLLKKDHLPLKCPERRTRRVLSQAMIIYHLVFFPCFVSHIDAEGEIESVDAPDVEVAGHRVARDVQDVPVNDYVSGPRWRRGGATSISRNSASTLSAYKSVAN